MNIKKLLKLKAKAEKFKEEAQAEIDFLDKLAKRQKKPYAESNAEDDSEIPFASNQVISKRRGIQSVKIKGGIFQMDGVDDEDLGGDTNEITRMWNYQPATTDDSFMTEVWWEFNVFVDKWWALASIYVKEFELLTQIRDNVFRGTMLFGKGALVRVPKQIPPGGMPMDQGQEGQPQQEGEEQEQGEEENKSNFSQNGKNESQQQEEQSEENPEEQEGDENAGEEIEGEEGNAPNQDLDEDGVVGEDDIALAKGDVGTYMELHNQDAMMYGQKPITPDQAVDKMNYLMYDYIAVEFTEIDPVTKIMKCRKYQPWGSVGNRSIEIPQMAPNGLQMQNNMGEMLIPEQDYIVMKLWYDDIGMYPKGLPLMQKYIYHKRMRDKNCAWLQVFCDTSAQGNSKPNWLTRIKNFFIRDKSVNAQDIQTKATPQPLSYLGQRIRWYAPEKVAEVYQILTAEVAKDFEELNTRFGFPMQAADGRQTLSAESAQYASTFQMIQQYILEGLYHFCRKCKEKFMIDMDFYDIEEEMHMQLMGNMNAAQQDTQEEQNKKSNPDGKGATK